MNKSSILMLGASGWIGSYLVPLISKTMPHMRLLAAYNSHSPNFVGGNVETIQLSSKNLQCLDGISPSVILNLSRGEQDIDFKFHRSLIDLSNCLGGRYIYASSSNAVDADVSKPHTEIDTAFAQSDYGKFKAKCESELLNSCDRPLAFRFSATHGWAPNRIARTEEFLKTLATNKEVIVRKGIVQNRTFVGDLVKQIAWLIDDDKAEGVFHLGTSDWSDELSFLRNLSEAFGYDQAQVVEGETVEWNMVTVPKRIRYSLPTEKQTILAVQKQTELSKYRKEHQK